jgi:hypothetical protein
MSTVNHSVTRNNVTVTLEQDTFGKRASYKGYPYLVIPVLKDDEKVQLEHLVKTVIPFLGVKEAAEMLDSKLRTITQAICLSKTVSSYDETDPANPVIKSTDTSKYLKAIQELSISTGESIPDMEDRIDKLMAEMNTFMPMLQNPAHPQYAQAGLRITKVMADITETQKKIQERKDAWVPRRKKGSSVKVNTEPSESEEDTVEMANA